MSREAMQMALDALEGLQTWSNGWLKFTDEIQALRQALETEQQPVAWTAMAFARLGEVRDKMRPDDVRIVQQFLDGDYTALEQALEEKQEPRPCKVGSACVPTENGSCACSQLTPSTNSVVTQTEQEPVAWRSTSPDGKLSNKFACKPTESNWVEPLYTAPPNREITCVCGAVWEGETMVHPPREREWVGLTAYEIQEIYSGNQHWGNFACAIEAKLKEKNS